MIGYGTLKETPGTAIRLSGSGSLVVSDYDTILTGTSSIIARPSSLASGDLIGSGVLFSIATSLDRGVAYLRPLISIGGSVNYAYSRQYLKPLTTYADDQYIPQLGSYGIAYLQLLTTYGQADEKDGEGVAVLSSLISRAGDHSYSIGSGNLKPLWSFSRWKSNFEESLISTILATHETTPHADTVIFVFEASAIAGTATSDRLAYDELLSPGTIEGIATSTASRIVAVYNTGEVTEFYASDRLAREQFIQDVVAAGGINPATIFNVTVDNPLQVDGAINALMSLLHALEEQAIIEGTATTLHDRLVEFFSYPTISDTSLPVKQSGGIWEIPGISDSRTWVVNLDTSTSSQYDGYGYNSFFERDGKYYGVADDGIYLLEGENDAGKDIMALVDQGLSDYGTFHTKKATDVYIACASGGRLQLKVVVDGVEKVYQTNSHSNTIKEHRVQISRQQLGSEWQLVWSNQGGDDFDISEIDFHIFPMNRRIR